MSAPPLASDVPAQAMLAKHFGFDAFRPGQEEVVDVLLGRGRALAVFPTGGGKSICYQLPALMLDGLTDVTASGRSTADLAATEPGQDLAAVMGRGDAHATNTARHA